MGMLFGPVGSFAGASVGCVSGSVFGAVSGAFGGSKAAEIVTAAAIDLAKNPKTRRQVYEVASSVGSSIAGAASATADAGFTAAKNGGNATVRTAKWIVDGIPSAKFGV